MEHLFWRLVSRTLLILSAVVVAGGAMLGIYLGLVIASYLTHGIAPWLAWR